MVMRMPAERGPVRLSTSDLSTPNLVTLQSGELPFAAEPTQIYDFVRGVPIDSSLVTNPKKRKDLIDQLVYYSGLARSPVTLVEHIPTGRHACVLEETSQNILYTRPSEYAVITLPGTQALYNI